MVKKIIFIFLLLFNIPNVLAVEINSRLLEDYLSKSCELGNIEFKKELWESDLAETATYSAEIKFREYKKG